MNDSCNYTSGIKTFFEKRGEFRLMAEPVDKLQQKSFHT